MPEQTIHEKYLKWKPDGESYPDWLLRHIHNRRIWIYVSQSNIEDAKAQIQKYAAEKAELEAELARIASEPQVNA